MWPLWKKSEDAPEPKSASPTLASTPAGEDLTVPSHRERSITSGEDRRPYAAPIVDHSAGGTIATSSTASSSDTPAEHGAHSSPPQGSAGPSLAIIPTTAFLLGFAAGAYNNASRAGLIFMAENAHRRPDTVQGWFFYNKTKNYKVVLAAGKGGARTGLRLGLWTFAFLALERGWRDVRVWTGLAGDTAATGTGKATAKRPLETGAQQPEAAREGLDPYKFMDGALAGSVVASSAALFCESGWRRHSLGSRSCRRTGPSTELLAWPDISHVRTHIPGADQTNYPDLWYGDQCFWALAQAHALADYGLPCNLWTKQDHANKSNEVRTSVFGRQALRQRKSGEIAIAAHQISLSEMAAFARKERNMATWLWKESVILSQGD